MVPGKPVSGQRAAREPLFDVHPQTGACIEVLHADRTLETFGTCGAGWFWCSRRRGFSSDRPARGPFSTGYSAYRNALLAAGFESQFGVRTNRGRGVLSCVGDTRVVRLRTWMLIRRIFDDSK